MSDAEKRRSNAARRGITPSCLLKKRHAAGDNTCDNAVPEESPFGRSQTLKIDRLRQPALYFDFMTSSAGPK